MEVLVPWQRLIDALSPSYFPNAAGKRGRPPIGLERMLRIYFLQQWYALADEALAADGSLDIVYVVLSILREKRVTSYDARIRVIAFSHLL